MAYLGDFVVSALLDHKFTTVSGAGVPTTLLGSPAISVYKNNSTVPSTAGVSLTVDFNSTTGMNHVRIDMSADTTFYAPGNNYQIVITAGTVGGNSAVGYVVGAFSIMSRSAAAPLCRGIVGAGATTGSIPTSSLTPAASDTDQFKGRIVIFDTTTATVGLRGEAASVQTSSSGGVLTVDTLSRAPASGDTFGIY